MKTILCAAVTLFSSVLIASPAEYAADVSTPEARATLVKRLWAHDEKAETKLWPEGKTPLKVSDKPIKFLEHELWQSNLVVTAARLEQGRHRGRRMAERARLLRRRPPLSRAEPA